jgi:hypothetical protein
MPRIENWTLNQHMSTGAYYLSGNIYNHPNPMILNGELSRTSFLLRIDFEKNTAETLNTLYELGVRSI